MRKSLVVYIASVLGVILLFGFFQLAGQATNVYRYHQHLEETSEKGLAPCPLDESKDELCTHLPIITIETGGKRIPGEPITIADGTSIGYESSEDGEEEIQIRFSTIDKIGVMHHTTDKPSSEGDAMMRIRGNSSRRFAKKSYRIRIIENESPLTEENLPLLGMREGSEWAIHGPFLDKSLMRNYMWMNISAQIMGYAPNVRFFELILDGDYQGVYLLMETIKKGEGRVNLRTYNRGDSVFSYLIRLDSNSNPIKAIDNFAFYTERLEEDTKIELLYPGITSQTQDVKRYVTEDFSNIERMIFSRKVVDDPNSIWDYLDINSFVDYYIIQEFLGINDMFSASTYFYKDVRGKLHIGPAWDYNNALNNFFTELPENEFLLSQRVWYSQLMKSERFVEQVIRRYERLRKGVLAEEYLIDYARGVEDWLGTAIERNYQVWGYSFNVNEVSIYEKKRPYSDSVDITEEDLNPSNYDEAMEWMLDFMENRGDWLDDNIYSLRQYYHPSKNAAISLE